MLAPALAGPGICSRRSVIGDSDTGAEDRLGRDLVSHSQARTERPGVVLGKLAVAGRLVDNSTGMATRGRIRQCGRQGRHAAVLLARIGVVVITQSVVQRQPPRDLPGILRIEAPELLPGLQVHRRIDGSVVHQSQQETGVGEAHGSDAQRRRLHRSASRRRAIRKLRRLIRREDKSSVRRRQTVERITKRAQLAAEFIGMVAFHPGQRGLVGGRELIGRRLDPLYPAEGPGPILAVPPVEALVRPPAMESACPDWACPAARCCSDRNWWSGNDHRADTGGSRPRRATASSGRECNRNSNASSSIC